MSEEHAVPTPQPTRPSRLRPLWWVAVVLTLAWGALGTWFTAYFHLFGDTADAEDYVQAAELAVGTAIVLVVGALAALRRSDRRWVGWRSASCALVLAAGFLATALTMAQSAQALESGPVWSSEILLTAGQMFITPWGAVLLLAGAWGVAERITGQKQPSETTTG